MRAMYPIVFLSVFLRGCLLAAPLVADEPARPSAPWPELAVANVVDGQIFARLRALELVPSRLASDAEFLRRVSLTTIGQLPTAAEVRAFLEDQTPDKRARKIDELLDHKLRAAMWATRFSALTGNSLQTLEGPDELKPKRAKMWHDWLRKRFAENVPYNAIVRGILTATSRGVGDVEPWIDEEAALVVAARQSFDASYANRPGLDLFWRRDSVNGEYPAKELAERVASSFLGVRINCAKCHKHPFDRWTQEDYRALAGVFAQVRFDLSPPARARLAERIEARRRRAAEGGDAGPALPRVREVYLAELPTPMADAPVLARALDGPAFSPPANAGEAQAAGVRDFRGMLMDWLDDPHNPYFARNIVNRVWAYHFGRGLVEPLDGFSADNPPSHPALLDELAAEFVAHGYDLRWLERMLLNSTTWQLSSEPNDVNRGDRRYFSRAYVRIPPAETVIDMWQAATGTPADFGDAVPGGTRAVEIGPSRLGVKRWDTLLDLFGRSARTQTCDCAPVGSPSIRQTLALMCDTSLLADLSAGALITHFDSGLRGDALVDELFLRTLSRLPTDDERAAALQAAAAEKDERLAYEDILWGLVNCQEFVTNH